MSAISTLPRNGGNGAALVVVVADLLMSAYSALTAKSAPKVKAVPIAAVKPAGQVNVWQLYRLAGDSDSINPKVVAKLHKELAA